MSKREKIIVGLMVAAILYGGYTYLFSGSAGVKKTTRAKPPVAVNAFVADLVKRIQGVNTTATDAEILSKSSAQWQRDPFLTIPKSVAAEEKW